MNRAQRTARRAAIYGATIIAATAAAQMPLDVDPVRVAGNLYASHQTRNLSYGETDAIFSKAIEKFNDAGIQFSDFRVLGPTEFPDLSGLDILVYVVDDYGAQYNCNGVFGVGDNLGRANNDRTDYTNLRTMIGFPYDPTTSLAHTSFIDPEGMLLKHQELEVDQPETRNDEHKLMSELAAHEIGHGLGAVHLKYEDTIPDGTKLQSYNKDHIMGVTEFRPEEKEFYEANADRMKSFIDNLGAVPFISSEAIARKRMEFIVGTTELYIPRRSQNINI